MYDWFESSHINLRNYGISNIEVHTNQNFTNTNTTLLRTTFKWPTGIATQIELVSIINIRLHYCNSQHKASKLASAGNKTIFSHVTSPYLTHSLYTTFFSCLTLYVPLILNLPAHSFFLIFLKTLHKVKYQTSPCLRFTSHNI